MCPRIALAGFGLVLLGALLGPASPPPATAGPSAEPGRVAPAANAGPTLRGLSLASEYDAVRVPDAADLRPQQALTIELWSKRYPASACRTLVSKDRARSYWLGLCNGRLRFSAGGSGIDGNITVPEGRWTHLAATFDGQVAQLYVDGSLDQALPLTGEIAQANPADLSFGADAVPGSFFYGHIDHVRLWNLVRSGAQLRDAARSTLAPQAGLVGQWSLDGHARDLVGGHDGRPGIGSFSADGVLPGDLAIPRVSERPVVDGRCEPTEYGAAERVALEGTEPLLAYVQSAGDSVYLCLGDMARPGSANAAVAWHMDRNLSRDGRPQPGDYRFSVRQSGNAVVEEGDGTGGWKAATLSTGLWEANRSTTNERWSAELRVARSLFEPPRDPADPVATGLAIGYLNVRANGDDRFWPPAATTMVPSTWAYASLADTGPTLAQFEFSGRVEQDLGEGQVQGTPGATLRLVAVVDQVATLVDTGTSDGGGWWHLAWRGTRPDRFVVSKTDPPGVLAQAAAAPSPGTMAGANALVYDLADDNDNGDATFTGARFLVSVGPAVPEFMRRHYLIVYAPPVSEGDLWVLAEAKREQGFMVQARSTEDLARAMPGRDLAEQIRNWLKAVWEEADKAGEPVYVLLVGRGDKVPVRDVGWLGTQLRDPGRPGYYPAWPTDWYYADLDSDWDSNRNGFYGEYLGCPPGGTYWDEDQERPCPEAGSLAREGPYGALRGPEDDFRFEVALGRLAVNEPAEVRAATQAMVLAGRLSGPFKQTALLAGSFWEFAGQSYAAGSRTVVAGGDPESDAWLRRPWTGNRPFGLDAGDALEAGVAPVLAPLMPVMVRLYETNNPAEDPDQAPSLHWADAPLSAANFARYLSTRNPAWVSLAGRGGSMGVASAPWRHDWDNDGRIDQPAPPDSCLGQTVGDDRLGPPCRELVQETLLWNGLDQSTIPPPVVVANAGGTAGIAWTSEGLDGAGGLIQPRWGAPAIAGRLAGRGHVAAWVGSLGPVEPGLLDGLQAEVARQAVEHGRPLGEAVGQAMMALARANEHELRAYGPLLLGDPAFSYWGGLPDAWGAWPAAGGGWRGSGASAYSGPAIPDLVWTRPDGGPAAPAVIGRHGDLIVAGAGNITRLGGGGAVVAQASLPGGTLARYPAAMGSLRLWLAAGNTVYMFGDNLGSHGDLRLPGGGTASGGPRVGLAGEVYVPTQVGLARLEGAGQASLISNEGVIGTPAWRPSGELVWSNAAGKVEGYRILAGGQDVRRDLVTSSLGELTAAAVSPAGTVYVGSSTGRVSAIPEQGGTWLLEAGAPVRLRPAVALDGTVYVANARGQVLAFSAERRDLLWRAELGAPASAPPTVDAAHVFISAGRTLIALSRATGLVAWTLDLGGNTDERSEAVIGPDRSLYVTRADQTLVAVREAGWLAAPSEVLLDSTPSGATVRWRDNSTAETGFRIELCDLEGQCIAAGTAAAGATRLDVRQSQLITGRPFRARVQAVGQGSRTGVTTGSPAAVDANHSSELASSAPEHALPPPPSAPVGLSATPAASDALELRWRYEGDPEGLTGFDLARETASGWRLVAILGADERRFVDRDLQPDRSYRYALTAIGGRGRSDQAMATATTWRETLTAVSELTGRTTGGGISLSWRETNLRETGMVVERLDPGMAEYRTVAQLAANTQRFADTYSLAPGTYTYRIRPVATDGDGPWRTVTVRMTRGVSSRVFLPVLHRRW